MRPVTGAGDLACDVVIVTYNGRELVRDCLDSLARDTDAIRTILVVDNASSDGVCDIVRDEFPAVERLELPENLGFGRAANLGIARGTAPFILLLNPDTVVPVGAVRQCLEELAGRSDTGMLGCKLVRRDGSLDHACKRQIPTPWSALTYFARLRIGNRGYTARHVDADDAADVEAINGAFMLVRRAAVDQVGLFDERFWMYGEDLDWCVRFRQHGWRIRYWPGVAVTHVKGGVTGRRRRLRVNYAFHHSMWIFYRKHQAGTYPWLLNHAVHAGIWARFGVSVAVSAAARTVGFGKSVVRPQGVR